MNCAPFPVLVPTIKGHEEHSPALAQGEAWLWSSTACCVFSLYVLSCCFFRDCDAGWVSCLSLLTLLEALDFPSLTFSPHICFETRHTVKLFDNLNFTVGWNLRMWKENRAGRVSEWLAATTPRKTAKANPWAVMWSARGPIRFAVWDWPLAGFSVHLAFVFCPRRGVLFMPLNRFVLFYKKKLEVQRNENNFLRNWIIFEGIVWYSKWCLTAVRYISVGMYVNRSAI